MNSILKIMISVKVNEATEDYPIKKVFFEDSDIGNVRSIFIPSKIMCLEKYGNFIYEEVVIINRINNTFRMSIYAGDCYDLVAYSEHTKDKSKNTTRTINHILNNGNFKVMSSSLTEYNQNQKEVLGSKNSYLDMNGELLYYNLSDYQKITSKDYNKNNNEIISSGDFVWKYEDTYQTVMSITSKLINSAILKYQGS